MQNPVVGRNDPCPCNSGKKYKQCCLKKETPVATTNNVLLDQLLAQATKAYHVGQHQKAIDVCQHILALDKTYAEAWHLMAIIAYQHKQMEKAYTCMQKALGFASAPTLTMLDNMVSIAIENGAIADTIKYCKLSLDKKPDAIKTMLYLARAYGAHGQLNEAINIYGRIIDLDESFVQAYAEAGYLAKAMGKLEDALNYYNLALKINPDMYDVLNNLGGVYYVLGQLSEAIRHFDAAIQFKQDFAQSYSNRLMCLQYIPSYSPDDIYAEHRKFADLFEDKNNWCLHPLEKHQHKRLKIGYVSADLYRHSVAFFIEPILACHDKKTVELYCYYNGNKEDDFTQRLKSHVEHWHSCSLLSDVELVQRIQQDEIDILVDLSGHTAGNRLPVFAHKPAPIQVTWIGYPGTTGLKAMDYRITDAILDPEGLTDAYNSEVLYRLPSCTVFQPLEESPAINTLPALNPEQFIFACLNNPAKINQHVIALWARLLERLPHAKIMLGNTETTIVRNHLINMFADHGISVERLILKPKMPLKDFLALHHEIDLALDPFPYGGGTTTNHSLWMGVPVVTLAGHTTVSRHGAYNLTAAGLTDFITYSEEEYIEKAVFYAQHVALLNDIRQGLRDRILSQPERNPAELTSHLEAAFQTMYQRWVASLT